MNNEELVLLNKWSQEICEVTRENVIKSNGQNTLWMLNGKPFFLNEWDKWTLADARCREIVREHFNIQTYNHEEEYWYCDTSFAGANYTFGDSIEAAEINCINAIRLSEVK